MLLVAILGILSNQGLLLGMERFAKRHRKTLNELIGTRIANPPSDSTFRLLLSQLDVDGFNALLQQSIGATLASLSTSTRRYATAKPCVVRSLKPLLAQRVLSLRGAFTPTPLG